jgi:hypothetical protein
MRRFLLIYHGRILSFLIVPSVKKKKKKKKKKIKKRRDKISGLSPSLLHAQALTESMQVVGSIA